MHESEFGLAGPEDVARWLGGSCCRLSSIEVVLYELVALDDCNLTVMHLHARTLQTLTSSRPRFFSSSFARRILLSP
jgi:hypothetical protein